MKPLRVAVALVMLCTGVYGQQLIDLSGKITNGAGGTPIAGATVRITTKNLSTLSAADGSYRLHVNATVVPRVGRDPQQSSCAINGKKLKLTLTNGDRFSAELFDIKGRCRWKTSGAGQRSGDQDVTLPLEKIPGQTGLVRVTLGAERRYYRFVNCDRTSLFLSPSQTPPTSFEAIPSLSAKTTGTLPILDTLVASSTGLSRNGTVHIYVYNFVDTIDVSLGEQDSFSEARQQCIQRINTYRATLHLKPFIRYAIKEFCVDSQAKNDCVTNTAHGAFGWCKEMAQDECPAWGGTTVAAAITSIITGCLQEMWDEGPGEPYSAHGHYINMSDTTKTKAACGFYWVPSTKKIWATQDFWP